MEKKKYKERVKWTELHEAIFVELWEEKMEEFRGVRKNTHIYAEMASDMQRHGLLLSAAEVKAKINNLTIKYRKEKGTTGCSPSEWPLFERVNSILGQAKSLNFASLTSDSITNYELEVGVIDAAEPSSPAVSPDCLLHVSPDCLLHVSPDFQATEAVQAAGPSTSAASSSPRDAAKIKKFNFIDLVARFDKAQDKIDANLQEIKAKDDELIALEREKVMLLRQQVNDASEVKEGVLKLLSQLGSFLEK